MRHIHCSKHICDFHSDIARDRKHQQTKMNALIDCQTIITTNIKREILGVPQLKNAAHTRHKDEIIRRATTGTNTIRSQILP